MIFLLEDDPWHGLRQSYVLYVGYKFVARSLALVSRSTF